MSSKRWAALIIAIALFFISVFYQFSTNKSATQYESLFSTDDFAEKVVRTGNLGGGQIAVLNLDGVIMDSGQGSFLTSFSYDHRSFLRMIEKAGADITIDGIIIKVNTPGGGVVESAEIHDKLLEVKEKYNKPVYVSMGNTAASGGYYISAPVDKIVAHPATVTGSIGVIMENINFAELADKYGVDFNTIKSGEFKDIMSSSRPMTETERAILQGIIDDLYDDFVQVIVDGRGLTEERVREIGDGRIYTGRQAKELGLVDELGTIDDTIAMMEEDLGLGGAQVVEYEIGLGFRQLIGLSAQNIFGSKTELSNILNALRDSGGPRAMYLYSR